MIWLFLIFVAVFVAMKVFHFTPKEVIQVGAVSAAVFILMILSLMMFLSFLFVITGGVLLL